MVVFRLEDAASTIAWEVVWTTVALALIWIPERLRPIGDFFLRRNPRNVVGDPPGCLVALVGRLMLLHGPAMHILFSSSAV